MSKLALWEHYATKSRYWVIGMALNSTNGPNDGEFMYVYYPVSSPNKIYVRNSEEFVNKFTLIQESDDEQTARIEGDKE